MDKQEAFEQVYNEIKKQFQDTRSSLKKEDRDRGLYTLEPTRADIIKYPMFSPYFITVNCTTIKKSFKLYTLSIIDKYFYYQ